MTTTIKRNIRLLGFVVFAMFLATGKMRATDLILNGDFSTTGSLPNSCGTGCSYSLSNTIATPDSTTIPDWTISTFTIAAGIVDLTSGTGNSQDSQYPPPDSLSTYAFTSGGTIYQTASESATPGSTYTLTFWESNLGAAYNQFDEAGTISGTSGALATTYGNSAAAIATSGDWTELELSYVDSNYSGPMTVNLFSQGGEGQAGFTNVCLTDTTCFVLSEPNVTPEPSTWVTMLTGLVGLGFAGHRAIKKKGVALA